MILEATCGAEREVEVVKGNEALEGCPTAPTASGVDNRRVRSRRARGSQLRSEAALSSHSSLLSVAKGGESQLLFPLPLLLLLPLPPLVLPLPPGCLLLPLAGSPPGLHLRSQRPWHLEDCQETR